MLDQTRNDHFGDGFKIGERLLGGRTPRCTSALDECRTVGIPAVIVRLYDDLKCVGSHPFLR
jgi:hypothetical protein